MHDDTEPSAEDVEAELVDDGSSRDDGSPREEIRPEDRRAERQKGGGRGVVLAAIVAALIAIVGAGGFVAGVLRGPSEADLVAQLEAAMEARLAEVDTGGDAGELEPLRAELKALETAQREAEIRLRTLESTATVIGELPDMQRRIETLSAQVAAGGGRGDSGGAAAEIGALYERLDDLEAQLTEVILVAEGAGRSGGAASSDAALTAGDDALQGAGSADLLGERLTQLQDRVARLQNRVAQTDEAVDIARSEAERLGADTDRRLQRLESVRLTGLPKRTAVMIAFTNLRDAADAGRPFRLQYQTLEAMTDGAPGLGLLEKYADAGLPPRGDLVTAFPEAADAAWRADQRAAADGAIDGLLSGMKNVFTVRPVGDVEGEATGPILARAEARVGEGDFAAALLELRGLPEDPAAAMGAWISAAEAQVALQAALDAAYADILRALPEG